MMWDRAMVQMLARLKEQAALVDLFGDTFRMAGSSALEVPSVEYTILSDTTAEIWEPVLVQIDLWTNTSAQNRMAERIVRSVLDQRTSIRWDDVTLIAEYTDGSQLATPDRAGFVGRGLRFRFSLLKQQYSSPEI